MLALHAIIAIRESPLDKLDILLLLLLSFIVLVGFYAFLRTLFSVENPGLQGEERVARQLGRLHSKRYIVLNDLFFEIGGWTSQIDHVVISRAGLFVIETKNLRGWIHGHQNAQYWHQTFYNTRKNFLNPIRQNRGHIVAIKKLLRDHPGLHYFSIVVFAGKARLMNPISLQYEEEPRNLSSSG